MTVWWDLSTEVNISILDCRQGKVHPTFHLSKFDEMSSKFAWEINNEGPALSWRRQTLQGPALSWPWQTHQGPVLSWPPDLDKHFRVHGQENRTGYCRQWSINGLQNHRFGFFLVSSVRWNWIEAKKEDCPLKNTVGDSYKGGKQQQQ